MAEPKIVPVLRLARYDVCVAAYWRMFEQCEAIFDTDPVDGPPARMLWSGYISALMQQLGRSQQNGSNVFHDLERMGCIEIKQRGKRGTMTQVVLQKPPTEELFTNFRDATYNPSRKQVVLREQAAKDASVLERLRILEETVEKLLDVVNTHLEEHDVTELESDAVET